MGCVVAEPALALHNCHGAAVHPNFFGQSSGDIGDMPVSHRADFVARPGHILEGTVAVAECCYGGELYDPAIADGGQIGMCNTYLSRKAYGFFGSTTIAYGPQEGNGQADLICQYFVQSLLEGASLGRAALEARLRFVAKEGGLSMTDRKTLAQFNLYGDPSIEPVGGVTPPPVAKPGPERRKSFTLAPPSLRPTPEVVAKSLSREMGRAHARPVEMFSFAGNLHVMVGTRQPAAPKSAGAIRRLVVLEAVSRGGRIMVGQTHSK